MGDIVVYDRALNPQRFWVPQKDVRWWLRHYRTLGYPAMTLNQWKRNGMRPPRPIVSSTDRLGQIKRIYGIRNDDSVT